LFDAQNQEKISHKKIINKSTWSE